MSVGGSIQSIGINGRTFSVAADAESQRKKGGFENEVQANGDGTSRLIKTTVPLKLDGITVDVDDTRGDAEFLQEAANLLDFFVIDITYASGVTLQGSAQITGEFQISSQSQTASITLEGPGILTKQ